MNKLRMGLAVVGVALGATSRRDIPITLPPIPGTHRHNSACIQASHLQTKICYPMNNERSQALEDIHCDVTLADGGLYEGDTSPTCRAFIETENQVQEQGHW